MVSPSTVTTVHSRQPHGHVFRCLFVSLMFLLVVVGRGSAKDNPGPGHLSTGRALMARAR
jgi:hypothetical protein